MSDKKEETGTEILEEILSGIQHTLSELVAEMRTMNNNTLYYKNKGV